MRQSKNNNQLAHPSQIKTPFDMFDQMASKMMQDFGGFGSMSRGFPEGSLMNRLEDDHHFGNFGGVFGRDFMNMDSMLGKMLQGMDENSGNEGNGQIRRLPGGGVVQAQTYCFSSSMGQDGKPVTKKYFAHQSKGLGQQGEEIGEMQEMYHNSENQRKVIAEERTIDGQGRRVVKSKIGDGKFIYTSLKPTKF